MESLSTTNGFLKLIPEARNEVYRYLLLRTSEVNMCTDGHGHKTSHHTEILRTCHLIYAEASSIYYGENTFLYQTGCTMDFPMRRWNLPPASISPRICSMMNKIELVLDERYHTVTIAKALLQAFGGSEILRDQCLISVKSYEKWCHLWDFIEVENLTGFDTLDLRISVDQIWTDTDAWWCRVLTSRLATALGPIVLYVLNNHVCFQFRPRMFALASRLPQALPLILAPSSTNDHPPNKASLLTLPSKVRAHIIDYVFDGPNTVNISCGLAIGPPKNYLAILKTCRKIHEEASKAFYGDTYFTFHIRYPNPNPFPMSPRLGALMKHVNVIGM